MVESLSELRKKVQVPVRPYNDVAGVLVGDWVSLPVTRAFLVLGWSPTVGTIGMLVFGLLGSALVLLGDAAAVAGFACVFLYYVMDCVDGEVARYHGAQKLVWGFYEFFFHLAVKSAFFVCLGVAAVRTTGMDWVFGLALAALLATLFQKFLRDVALAAVCRAILLKGPRESAWAARQLDPDLEQPVAEPEVPADGAVPFPSFGGRLATARAVALNFDLSLLFFLLAAVADLVLPGIQLLGTSWNLKAILLAFYGIGLPLNFVDHLVTYARRDRFLRDCRDLLRRAHRYRVPD